MKTDRFFTGMVIGVCISFVLWGIILLSADLILN